MSKYSDLEKSLISPLKDLDINADGMQSDGRSIMTTGSGTYSDNLQKSNQELLSQDSNTESEDEQDSELPFYDVEGQGKVIIFNQNFEEEVKVKDENKMLPPRDGTKVDVARLDRLFKWLNCEVRLYNDKTKSEMETIMAVEATDEENKNFKYLVVSVLTHGKENGIYTSDGDFLEIKTIVDRFDGENCPKMLGKPKWFIVQACRGEDHVKKIHFDGPGKTPSENSEINNKKPEVLAANTDIVIFYSTTFGTKTFRSPTRGSWFIRALCNTLETMAATERFYDIVLSVNGKIAKKEVKQMCSLDQNTLRKKLKFQPTVSFEEFKQHYQTIQSSS